MTSFSRTALRAPQHRELFIEQAPRRHYSSKLHLCRKQKISTDSPSRPGTI